MTLSSFHEIDAFVEAEARKDPETFVLSEDLIGVMTRRGVESREIDKIVGPAEVRSNDDVAGMLTVEASEKVARLAHVVSLAQKVFGSDHKAFLWLRAPNPQLGGKTPIDCVTRESGARFVEDVLIRIDHGIAA